MEKDKNAGFERGHDRFGSCGPRFGMCHTGAGFCKVFLASLLAIVVFAKCAMMSCHGGMMKGRMIGHAMMAKKVHPYNQCLAISLAHLNEGSSRKSVPTKEELVERLKMADANCAKLSSK